MDWCPRCSEDISEQVHSEWIEAGEPYEETFEVACPECDYVMTVEAQAIPEFTVE